MDIKQIIYDATLYIHRMYDEPITITDISAQAYLSPSYFSSQFRIFTGFTVKNYLNRYRLYRAAMDLKNSGKQIVEITYINGFSSQQAFTRSFSQMYGIAPAQFRLLNPAIDPFPPKNLWKEPIPIMELMECFENVRFIKKESFFVAGLEVDIHYNSEDGTSPIGDIWKVWKEENLGLSILDQVSADGTVYGLTHSEDAKNKAKYMVCVEVKSLSNLPVGFVGRRFPACERAVFNTTLDIIWTRFWHTFYAKWLPNSGYTLPDSQLKETYPTFTKHPDIEVYPSDWKNNQSIMQVYAPVVKK